MHVFREVLVSYDIENDRSRTKLCDSLKDIGLVSIQKSVMWGMLLNAEISQVMRLLKKYGNPNTDKAFVLEAEAARKIKQNNIGYKNEFDEYQRNYTIL